MLGDKFTNCAGGAWRTMLAVTAAACAPLLLFSGAAQAQELVQQTPSPAVEQLNDAMRRLARNPESFPALLAAGRASLELGDVDAANGFLLRAQAVDPSDGRVMAGLALVALRQHNPIAALQLFEQAGAAGIDLSLHAADRALAYDLVGNNAAAQQLYGQALAGEENAEAIRRLALSYAISGDREASDAVLLPLLQRRDLAAFRTRAFALAIVGEQDEAVSIAETMLPPRLSSRITPYLRYMTRLTRAQQAAAAILGLFPAASEIGRENAQFAPWAGEPVQRASRPGADSRLIPEGAPLGSGSQPVSSQLRTAQQSGASLSEAFDAFSSEEEAGARSASGDAVDITAIEPPREVRAAAEPAQPSNPSRHWVQLATGRDVSAFRFDWRRLARNANGLLDGREPHRVRWNQTNRLVTGPFDSAAEAQDFVTALGRQGIDAFRFTSAEGEEVVALD